MRACPYCAEQIQDEAVVCRFCGRSLVGSVSAAGGAGTVATARAPAWTALLGLIGGVTLVLSVFLEYSEGYQPLTFDTEAAGGVLAIVANAVYNWLPPIVAIAAAGLMLLGGRSKALPGILLGAGAAALALPVGNVLQIAAYEFNFGPGLFVALGGCVVLLIGGLFAVIQDPPQAVV